MDVKRSCSRAWMWWDAAQTKGSYVRWYFADGAPFFPGPHLYCSEIWDRIHWWNPGAGEAADRSQPYDRGAPPEPFYPVPTPGHPLCAPSDWYVEGAPSNAPPLVWVNHIPECCIPGITLQGCSCGSRPQILRAGCSCAKGSLAIVPPETRTITGCSCAQQGGVLSPCTTPYRIPYRWRAVVSATGCMCFDGQNVLMGYTSTFATWSGSNNVTCALTPVLLDLNSLCHLGDFALGSTGTSIQSPGLSPGSTVFPFHFRWQALPGQMCPGPIVPITVGVEAFPD